jgi:uncharacterized membrane-anchored protein
MATDLSGKFTEKSRFANNSVVFVFHNNVVLSQSDHILFDKFVVAYPEVKPASPITLIKNGNVLNFDYEISMEIKDYIINGHREFYNTQRKFYDSEVKKFNDAFQRYDKFENNFPIL